MCTCVCLSVWSCAVLCGSTDMFMCLHARDCKLGSYACVCAHVQGVRMRCMHAVRATKHRNANEPKQHTKD